MSKGGLSFGFIQKLCVFYLAVWTISPPLEIDMIYRLIALGAAALWFFIMIIRAGELSLSSSDLASLGFMVVIMIIEYIATGSFSGVIKLIAYYILIMCYIMNRRYNGSWDELKGIIQVVLILCIFFNFKSFSALKEDPTIARLLVRDTPEIYEYLRQGVGGYSLIYPQVCIIPAGVAWTISSFKHNKLDFIIGTVWLISFVMYSLNAGYSLALFASAVGIVMLFFYKRKSGMAAFLVAVGIFAAVMLSILYIDSLRNFLLTQFDGTAVAKKINDLVSSSETGSAEGSIGDRIKAYSASIKAIFQYPIIGALWRPGGGGHSAFLDTLAKYGIAGGVIFTRVMYTVPNFYKNNYDDSYIMRTANATLVTLLFVTVLDSFTYAFVCMIMFITPMFFEDIIKWRGIKNESSLER